MLGSLKKPRFGSKKKPSNLFKFATVGDRVGTKVFLIVGNGAEALGVGACVGYFDGECEGD